MRRGVDCLTSFFEIGGHIIECDITSHSSSTLMVSAAERPERGRIAARSQASPMLQTSSSTGGLTVRDVASRVGRAQRARRAIAIAATLAAADGPLPIGDTIAIVGLTIYAGWELGHAVGILE